jgi:aldehyde dehydrogenase (NAD+)
MLPIVLLLEPLINALSAGNNAIVKPSESVSHVSATFEKLIPQYFEEEAVAVVTGGKETVTQLLELPFNFIFFTGSTKVGKVVMRAAAENLTPVLLELGGQNPVLVDENCKFEGGCPQNNLGWHRIPPANGAFVLVTYMLKSQWLRNS